MNHKGSSFLCGCAVRTGVVFFSKENDNFVKKGHVNSSFFLWYEDDPVWMKYDSDVEWRAVSMATVCTDKAGLTRATVAIGSTGQYFEIAPADPKLEITLGLIQEGISGMRCLSSIEETLYAAGMGRRVFERISAGNWKEIGPGETIAEKKKMEVIGFEDIAGFSKDDIYAVGWKGEIWRYHHKKWNQIDSPVSGNFNALTCAGNGFVYAVGDNGLMVRGKEDVWEVIETERPEDLLDVAFYEDEVYVITGFELLKLEDDVLVEVTNFKGDDYPKSCIALSKARDGVVLFGNKDLFRLKDGEWERIV